VVVGGGGGGGAPHCAHRCVHTCTTAAHGTRTTQPPPPPPPPPPCAPLLPRAPPHTAAVVRAAVSRASVSLATIHCRPHLAAPATARAAFASSWRLCVPLMAARRHTRRFCLSRAETIAPSCHPPPPPPPQPPPPPPPLPLPRWTGQWRARATVPFVLSAAGRTADARVIAVSHSLVVLDGADGARDRSVAPPPPPPPPPPPQPPPPCGAERRRVAGAPRRVHWVAFRFFVIVVARYWRVRVEARSGGALAPHINSIDRSLLRRDAPARGAPLFVLRRAKCRSSRRRVASRCAAGGKRRSLFRHGGGLPSIPPPVCAGVAVARMCFDRSFK
jgi:hypothetical protein